MHTIGVRRSLKDDAQHVHKTLPSPVLAKSPSRHGKGLRGNILLGFLNKGRMVVPSWHISPVVALLWTQKGNFFKRKSCSTGRAQPTALFTSCLFFPASIGKRSFSCHEEYHQVSLPAPRRQQEHVYVKADVCFFSKPFLCTCLLAKQRSSLCHWAGINCRDCVFQSCAPATWSWNDDVSQSGPRHKPSQYCPW